MPTVLLSAGFWLTGDLDQDGAEETLVHLAYGRDGTGNFGYLSAMGRKDDEIVQKAIGLVGDRAQNIEARIDDLAVVTDVLQAGPGDGMCCRSQLAARTFIIQNGKLVETASAVTGRASISMLEGKEWLLRFGWRRRGKEHSRGDVDLRSRLGIWIHRL